MHFRTAAILCAATMFSLVAACGGGPETKETTGNKVDTADAPKVDSKEIQAYFESLATDDADAMQKALDVAAPESVAYAYALHQQNLANAGLDAGLPTEVSKSKEVEGGYESCSPQENEDDYCVTYTAIQTEGGKIANFTVSDRDVSKAIALGGGKVVKIGKIGTIEYLSSYESAAGDLFITYRVKAAESTINVQAGQATYRGTDGRQRTASNGVFPTDLSADSTATMFSVFPKAKVGGEITIDVYGNDYNVSEKATFKTR